MATVVVQEAWASSIPWEEGHGVWDGDGQASATQFDAFTWCWEWGPMHACVLALGTERLREQDPGQAQPHVSLLVQHDP